MVRLILKVYVTIKHKRTTTEKVFYVKMKNERHSLNKLNTMINENIHSTL